MRLRILHETRYLYRTPAQGVIQTVRMVPRDHDGQYIANWRIDVDHDCRLQPVEDAFGNLTHTFTLDGPVAGMVITAEGEVETQNSDGMLKGTVERFPPELYQRGTALTQPDAHIQDFARDVAAKEQTHTPLNILHALLKAVNKNITFDTNPTHAGTTAAQAFALRCGVCQDLTHIFLVAARHLDFPARYVSGYFHRSDGHNDQDASHAWAEAHVPNLGWVGFDPANGISTTDAHVRVAIGLDYLSVAPVRGYRYGGAREKMDVRVVVQAR